MTHFEQWLNSFDEETRNFKVGKMFCSARYTCNDCIFKELCGNVDKLPYVEIGKILLQEVGENGCQENNQKEGH